MVNLEQPVILVVDDTPTNIDILSNTLRPDFKVKAATSGKKALHIAFSDNPPDIILLDIMMPEMDGYEVCERLKNDPATQDIPVIFITAMTDEVDEARGLSLGAVDYITKPFSPALVKARVINHIELKKHRDQLEDLVMQRTQELELTQEVTIEAMGTLAEYRDPETGGHIRRTQHYVRLLAEHLCNHPKFSEYLDDKTIKLLYQSAPLHDIGKVGVKDNILLKPGKLTDEEFIDMKKHVDFGGAAIASAEQRLGDNSFLHFARKIAETHHEKWDGSGYPAGIKGEDIPVCGRLMAIADVYDALISKRVYKPPFTHKTAVEFIVQGRGSHFDPDMVDAFIELQEEFRQIALEFADHDEERAALNQC